MPLSFKSRIARSVRSLLGVEHRRWLRRCYSFEGEDLLLARYFFGQSRGFYIDVGAHHPHFFSNTQLFYERGWRGINIDAMPGSMEAFRHSRPRDINLEVGVGKERSECTFFLFNEPALNTFDEETARLRDVPPSRLIGEITRPVVPLADILAEHVPAGTVIDFLNVDVEGRDFEVLGSNDWDRYAPRVVLAELYDKDFAGAAADPVSTLLAGHGYTILAKTVHTVMYARDRAGAFAG